MSSYYATMQASKGPKNVVPNTDFEIWANKNLAIKNYKDTAVDMLQLYFPSLTHTELEYAVDRSIAENLQWHEAVVDNSYKKSKAKITLPELANYIMSRQPIMTTYGVLFTKHADIPHPLYKMVDDFINSRDKVKKEMFKHPKGTFEFQKYSLLQLLYKLDANAFYGCEALDDFTFLQNWNTGSCINMNGMFSHCTSFSSINLSNWDVSNVEDMSYMFGGCTGLISVDFTNWNTKNVRTFTGMFGPNGDRRTALEKLVSIKGIIDLENCTNYLGMFEYCTGLTHDNPVRIRLPERIVRADFLDGSMIPNTDAILFVV